MHHTGILVLSIRGYSSDFNINRILMSSRTRKLGDLQNRKLACREREGESGVGRRRRLSEIGNCARRRITRSSSLLCVSRPCLGVLCRSSLPPLVCLSHLHTPSIFTIRLLVMVRNSVRQICFSCGCQECRLDSLLEQKLPKDSQDSMLAYCPFHISRVIWCPW